MGGADACVLGAGLQVESVQLIADGKAPRVTQSEEGASYEGIQKKSNAKVRRPHTHTGVSGKGGLIVPRCGWLWLAVNNVG